MERLTEKDEEGRYGFITENNTLGIFDKDSLADKCYTKLGQLEDIEEELGIDLITLFKTLKNGVFVKDEYERTIKKHYIFKCYFNVLWFDLEFETFEGVVYHCGTRQEKDVYTNEEKYIKDYKSHPAKENSYSVGMYGETTIRLKDYGKTWALTKEELEYEKRKI